MLPGVNVIKEQCIFTEEMSLSVKGKLWFHRHYLMYIYLWEYKTNQYMRWNLKGNIFRNIPPEIIID